MKRLTIHHPPEIHAPRLKKRSFLWWGWSLSRLNKCFYWWRWIWRLGTFSSKFCLVYKFLKIKDCYWQITVCQSPVSLASKLYKESKFEHSDWWQRYSYWECRCIHIHLSKYLSIQVLGNWFQFLESYLNSFVRVITGVMELWSLPLICLLYTSDAADE